ncbi:hypothetical protein V5799_020808 [Amblyomma americanum]|uniref:Uncharacterized protein n=1 Tax=Amblyomma americanum TaxID=6943 RepID=A0AAQ4ET24_AMBAM
MVLVRSQSITAATTGTREQWHTRRWKLCRRCSSNLTCTTETPIATKKQWPKSWTRFTKRSGLAKTSCNNPLTSNAVPEVSSKGMLTTQFKLKRTPNCSDN